MRKIFLYLIPVCCLSLINGRVAFSQNALSSHVHTPQHSASKSISGSSTSTNFSINKSSGAVLYSVPFTVPKGRNGLTPRIALSYSSQSGISWPARGWSLSMSCIKRETRRGVPKYNNNIDKFFFGSKELVRTDNESSIWEFREKIAKSFNRHRFHSQEDRWEIWTKNGSISYMGSMQPNSNSPHYGKHLFAGNKTFAWCQVQTIDRNHNNIKYYYHDSSINDGQIYPDYIT